LSEGRREPTVHVTPRAGDAFSVSWHGCTTPPRAAAARLVDAAVYISFIITTTDWIVLYQAREHGGRKASVCQ